MGNFNSYANRLFNLARNENRKPISLDGVSSPPSPGTSTKVSTGRKYGKMWIACEICEKPLNDLPDDVLMGKLEARKNGFPIKCDDCDDCKPKRRKY